MARIHYQADGALPPERFIAALTDFSERRPQLWPNLSPKYWRLHEASDTWAEVTEGTDVLGGVWARERYDWSTPGLVVLRLVDAVDFVPGTTIEYWVTPRDGGCHVEVDFQRIGRSLRGRFVGALVQLGGPRMFGGQLRETLARLEREMAAGSAPPGGAAILRRGSQRLASVLMIERRTNSATMARPAR